MKTSHNPQEKGGLILVHKKPGLTSFQVVNRVRKIINVKKAGHSGTLDKAAEGLLLICYGKSTKLLKFLTGQSKQYRAKIRFGIQTSTDDEEGEVLQTNLGPFDREIIESKLKYYSGKIIQTPPDYSAVHVNGKRAYQIIRETGKKPEIKSREVTIHNLKVLDYTPPILELDIFCSSGTYIRSIARDLGKETGYYAHLKYLIRSAIGDYNLSNSYTLEDIENNNYKTISPFDILKIPSLEIKEEFIKDIKNGKKPRDQWFVENPGTPAEEYYKVHFQKELLALVKTQSDSLIYDFVF